MKPVFTDENYNDIDINILLKGLNNGSIEIHKCKCKCPNHIVLTHEEESIAFHAINVDVRSKEEDEFNEIYFEGLYINTDNDKITCNHCEYEFDIPYTEIS